MTERVQKPIPKPRIKPPSANGIVDCSDHSFPEQSTSEISIKKERETPEIPMSLAIEKPIGWNSSHSEETSGSPPPSIPPPRPPHLVSSLKHPQFIPPLGPPPPIPPRVAREASLPTPVDEKCLPSPACSDITNKTEDDENNYSEKLDSESLSSDRLERTSDDSYWPQVEIENREEFEPHEKALISIFAKPKNIYSVNKAEGEAICFCGWVLLKQGKKEFRRLWASIRQHQLLFMPSDEEECPILGPYDLSKLVFVGKSTENASDILVVLRQVASKKKESNVETLRFAPEINFAYWITLLAKCNCPSYNTLNEAITTIDAGSKIFIREGVTGLWNESFIFTKENTFFYFIPQEEVIKELDMRKFTQIKMEMPLADYCNHISHSQEGPLLIILDGSSLYIQSPSDLGTKMWFSFLQAQLKRPTRHLSDCRLTAEDIPVIVDKCIKFVSTYGIKQTGLYRRNGANTEAKAIFEALKNDPFGTHLTPNNDETINAIADVLRTFLRQLESPLIPLEIQPELYNIYERYSQPSRKYGPSEDVTYNDRLLEEKASDYKSAIQTLPKIHYNTLKKLIDHLLEVNAHEAENRASLDNLSRVFGPTTFTVDKTDETPSSQFCRTGLQICVMRDLLENFSLIFDVSPHKKAVEITEVFESKCVNKPRAEGFLIPVHLYKKDNQCFNIQSNWTAEHVVEYKLQNLKLDCSVTAYGLYEVLKGGMLERRIGDHETINTIALVRWLNWKAADAFLLLKKESTVFNPANTRPFAEDIKISEPGSKSFKTAQLRIEDGKRIQQFPKGEKLSKPQKEWSIDETVWFLGNCERKYPSNYPYTCTFLLRSGKYNIKCAGYCVAFVDEVQRTQWLNAITVCQRDYSPIVLVPDL
ncbi:hypothetical protein FO519_003158 [Halicephalobus sp. NKZ332]|nr:hypothetical protein FO519_003158 [Halicephalobus sp. NKZ332]